MLFRLNKYILFTLTTLLLAAFFVVDINKTNAAFDPAVTYAKPINGQLSADEWNNLKLDFLNTWGDTTAKGGIGIGINPRPVDFNGLLASSTITTFGGFIGSLNATNLSAGNFGANYSGGGGIWGFPYGKLGVSYSATEMQLGTATFAVKGNVGIGTASPLGTLHVKDPSNISTILLESSLGVTQNAKISFSQSGQNSLLISTGYKSPNDLNLIQFAPAENVAMTIRGGVGANSGNVGIGTTNPISKFHVVGVGSEVLMQIGTQFNMRADGVLNWGNGMNNGLLTWDTGKVMIGGKAGIDYVLLAGNTERMRITNTGNVGIGTYNPLQKLVVRGDNNTSPTILIQSRADIANTSIGALAVQNTTNSEITGSIEFRAHPTLSNPWDYSSIFFNTWNGYNSLSPKMIVRYDGNVGIGTTTPAYKLDVYGEGSFAGQVHGVAAPTQLTDAANKGYVDSIVMPSSTPIVGTQSGFWTAGAANSIYNNNLGNVGIGTTTPAYKLSVVGAGSGYLTFDNASYGGGGSPQLKLGTGASSGGSAGAYMTLQGKLEAWVDVVATNNNTNKKWMRFGTGQPQDTFSIQLLNDNGSSIISTPFSIKNDAPTGSFYVNSSGYVGIGTTTPGSLLTIGNAFGLTSGGTMYSGATTTRYVDLSGVLSSSIAVPNDIYSSGGNLKIAGTGNSYVMGNLGIGTTTPAAKLEVNGTFSTNDNARIGSLPLQYPYRRVDSYSHDGTGYYWGFGVNSGGTQKINSFYTGASRVFNTVDGLNVVSWIANEFNGSTPEYSKAISLNAAGNSYFNGGNVGIGTATPTAKLEVNGTFKVAGPLNSVVLERLSGTGSRIVMTDATGSLYATSSSVATGLPSSSVAGQTLRSDGSGWLANSNIFNNGANVGIGTTAPRSQLEVNGDILLPNGNSVLSRDAGNNVSVPLFQFIGNNLSVGNWEGSYVGGTYIKGGNGSVFVDFSQGNNASFVVRKVSGVTPTELMRVDVAGNLGVGTTNPSTLLDLANNFKITNAGTAYNSSNAYWLRFDETLGGYDSLRVQGDLNTAGVIETTGTTRPNYVMGNLGIGTSAPEYKFDVNGSSRFSGDMRLEPGNNLTFYDHSGVFPTATGGFVWDLNNDNAKIYAQQPSSDSIDLVFKLADNALATERFLFWVDDYMGEKNDAYPLLMDATKIVFNYPTVYGSGVSKNTDFYILGQGASNLSSAYLFGKASSGSVGIGTTNPQAKLEVNGTFKVAGSLNSVVLERLSGTGSRIVMTDSDGSLYATSSSIATGLPAASGIAGQTLRSDGANWVANSNIFNNGTNVGIGVNNPLVKLHVGSNITGSSPKPTDDFVISRNSVNTWHGLYIGENDWNVGGVIQSYYNYSSPYYSILSLGTRGWGGDEHSLNIKQGNVGIGTTNPGSLLSLGATAFDLTTAGTMYSGATTTRYVDLSGVMASSISVPNDIYSSGGSLKIAGTANSFVMGSLGVGTTNPAYKLDTVGTFRASASSSSIILNADGDVLIGI